MGYLLKKLQALSNQPKSQATCTTNSRAIGATVCPDIRQLAVSFDVCPTVFYLTLVQSFLVIPHSSFCCMFISMALNI